jgi:hypothetical protein
VYSVVKFLEVEKNDGEMDLEYAGARANHGIHRINGEHGTRTYGKGLVSI